MYKTLGVFVWPLTLMEVCARWVDGFGSRCAMINTAWLVFCWAISCALGRPRRVVDLLLFPAVVFAVDEERLEVRHKSCSLP